MNEQLIVKNFGPFDAKGVKVTFKKVTIFIGPTGGGKSTLVKLYSILRDMKMLGKKQDNTQTLDRYNILNHANKGFKIEWKFGNDVYYIEDFELRFNSALEKKLKNHSAKFLSQINNAIDIKSMKNLNAINQQQIIKNLINDIAQKASMAAMDDLIIKSTPHYVPAERVFVPAIEYSWAGLMRDDIGLPKLLLEFANSFSLSRKEVTELDIPFLGVKYLHIDGRDFIKIPQRDEPIMLLEAASGIQSVTPLLILIEHLSRNNKQIQNFIIEEPELNLYPSAQQGLLNWLIEKCTTGENDLIITTHSPYILSHLNLLLYAYQVAEKHPDRADDVAKIVPRESWINPKDFACYQVENGGVESLVNEELGLIDDNGLDNLSGDAADDFDNLIRLSKSVALK